jgi:hypothetical protein
MCVVKGASKRKAMLDGRGESTYYDCMRTTTAAGTRDERDAERDAMRRRAAAMQARISLACVVEMYRRHNDGLERRVGA